MLSKKEIDMIPTGNYPNRVLRKAFGDKHGTPMLGIVKDGAEIMIAGGLLSSKNTSVVKLIN